MLVEVKQAFYNEETGAVQPWRDIEVGDTLGNELVSEGLVAAIAAGGGGGGASDDVFNDYGIIGGNVPEFMEWYDGSTTGYYYSDTVIPSTFTSNGVASGGTLTVNEKTYTLPDSWKMWETYDDLPNKISWVNITFSITKPDDDSDYVASFSVSVATEEAAGSEPIVTASVANVDVSTLSKKILVAMGYIS